MTRMREADERSSLNAFARDVRATPGNERYARYHAALDKKAGLSTVACACIAINCCMGSGFLALPYIFSKAGLVLSSSLMVTMCVCMTMTTSWEAEAMVRAEAVSVRRLEKGAPSRLLDSRRPPKISNRTFEVTELCSLFGGPKLHKGYAGLLLCYLWSTSWAYTFVFSESLSTAIPLFGLDTCQPDEACPLYRVYALVFLCIAVPISILEPTEQATFQVAMSLFRGFVAVVMTTTALVEAYHPGLVFEEAQSLPEIESSSKRKFLSGLGALLPATIFALNINGNVPLIAKSMRDRERVDVAVRCGLWIPCAMYVCIGTSVAAAFGDAVPRSANVAWERFYFDGDSVGAAALRLTATIVVLFPAADVLSVFPLNTAVIANNVLAVYYGDKIDKMQNKTSLRRVSRFLAAVPPIAGACFCANFTRIIDYTGVLAIAISCFFPPLLSIFGSKLCHDELGHTRLDHTRYSLDHGKIWPKLVVISIGAVAAVLSLVL